MMEEKTARDESFAEEDRAFHSGILAPLDNALVGQLVTAFWEVSTVVYPRLGLPPAQDLDKAARAHGEMLSAAEDGDIEAYRVAVVKHYLPLMRGLRK